MKTLRLGISCVGLSTIALTFAVGCTDNEDTSLVCSLEESMDDLGDQAARVANYCNVPGSRGALKWYRVSASVPGTDDVVQLELWEGKGAFTGTRIHTGTFTIEGPEANLDDCGVCLRALGGKGTSDEREYFAISGTVEVTALGGDGETITATVRDVTFAQEADPSHACDATLAHLTVGGTIVAKGMGGGGGGGGGGGNNCPLIIGD
ncbi:MAG: hypothetical protein R3B48_27290 [Kofleriaceae bacterium]